MYQKKFVKIIFAILKTFVFSQDFYKRFEMMLKYE